MRCNRVYSYDIFDTCLIRSCGSQDFLFEIVAKRVFGSDVLKSTIYDFILLRKNAEEKARKDCVKEDVTIYEIYSYLDVSVLTNKSVTEFLEAEIQTQVDALVPVFEIQKEIESHHDNGESVIFVSDMYLSADVILPVLKKYGLFREGDSLFVSCDVGLAKTTGNLFNYIKDKLNIDFSLWYHTGDNSHSDIYVPRGKGIHVRQVNFRLSCYEKKMATIETSGSDFDVLKSSICSKSARLSSPSSPLFKFASDFVAPIYVPFVYNVLSDAKQRGIKKLFFIARDSFILYKIAQEFIPDFPELEVCYMKASRKSLYLPGIDKLTIDNLAKVFPFMSTDINDLLRILHMEDFPINTSDYVGLDACAIVKKLWDCPNFIKSLTAVYSEQSKLCFQYFQSIGLTASNSAIIDVFGTRRCEMAINNILQRNGCSCVFGYYYAVLWNRVCDGSKYLAMFYGDRTRYGVHDTYYPHKQYLLEQYFSITDQNRTIGYCINNTQVEPEYEQDILSYDYKKNIMNANIVVCTKYAQYYRLNKICHSRDCCCAAQSVFNDFFHCPKKEYLRALKDFSAVDETSTHKLLYKQNLLKVLLNRKRLTTWFQGNLIFNSGIWYPLMMLILRIAYYFKRKKTLSCI